MQGSIKNPTASTAKSPVPRTITDLRGSPPCFRLQSSPGCAKPYPGLWPPIRAPPGWVGRFLVFPPAIGGRRTNVEGRLCNPSQKLIADLADALGKTPMEVYQLGELKLEEQTLEIVRKRRLRVRSRQDLEVILEAAEHLHRSHLAALVEAAQKLLEE